MDAAVDAANSGQTLSSSCPQVQSSRGGRITADTPRTKRFIAASDLVRDLPVIGMMIIQRRTIGGSLNGQIVVPRAKQDVFTLYVTEVFTAIEDKLIVGKLGDFQQ